MTEVQKNHVESCNINNDLEYNSVAEYLSIKLDKGIHIQNEEEFDRLSAYLTTSSIFDISKAISLRNDIEKNIMERGLESILGLLGAGNEGIILQKKDDIIYIYNAGKNKNDLNPLVGTINNGMERIKSTDYTQETIIFDSHITNISNLSREVKLLEEKENKCDINIQQTQKEMAVLDTEVKNDNKPGFDITYNNPILSLEEIAKKAVSGELEGINDVEDNSVKKIEAIGQEEVVSLEKSHPVIKNDTIWDILQTKQFSFTEKQTNIAIEKLKSNSDFLSQLKSKNIHKIYPGEIITFSQELLNSLIIEESITESVDEKWSYKVKRGDTPGHILMKYKGVNWGNIDSIAKELNMSIVRLGETITLDKVIILKDGTKITKTDSQ